VNQRVSPEEDYRKPVNESLIFEVVQDERLSNEEADQLAMLFAQALVRNLLRKGSNNGNSRPNLKR
jgi:hypothetical protein